MKRSFQKMMQEQVQDQMDKLCNVSNQPTPKGGWIQVIRRVLGLTSHQLAKRMSCTQTNVTAFERREKAGTISLNALEQTAQAMNCQLVYFFVPNKPFDKLLEDQARLVAKNRLRFVGHSMELEQQGLTPQQKKQQEDDLVRELLDGNPKYLWEDVDEV